MAWCNLQEELSEEMEHWVDYSTRRAVEAALMNSRPNAHSVSEWFLSNNTASHGAWGAHESGTNLSMHIVEKVGKRDHRMEWLRLRDDRHRLAERNARRRANENGVRRVVTAEQRARYKAAHRRQSRAIKRLRTLLLDRDDT